MIQKFNGTIREQRKDGERNGERNLEQCQSLTERQQMILTAIENNGKHTAKWIANLLNIPQRTIERDVSFLRKTLSLSNKDPQKTAFGLY